MCVGVISKKKQVEEGGGNKDFNWHCGSISNAEGQGIYFLNVYIEKDIELNRKEQTFFSYMLNLSVRQTLAHLFK